MLQCPKCNNSLLVKQHERKAYCEKCNLFFSLNADCSGLLSSITGVRTDHPLRIFISYPHSFYEISKMIVDALVERGHTVWFDRNDIPHGADWRREIRKGIQESDVVLACLSHNAIRDALGNPGVCSDELRIALSVKGGNIKTILLEPEKDIKVSSALAHCQWIDLSDWVEKMKIGDAAFQTWFSNSISKVFKMIETNETIEFNKEIEMLRSILQNTDVYLNGIELLEHPFVGRKWVFSEVDRWLNTRDSGSLFVLYGDPGIGKSAFSVQLSFLEERIGAFICFDHRHVHYNTVELFVKSIAFQLAGRLSDYRYQLIRSLSLMNRESITHFNGAELFDQLIVQPLTKLHIDGMHDTICILIDGLGELSEEKRLEIVDVISQETKKFPQWLKVLITSRRDNEIIKRLQPYNKFELIGEASHNIEDVEAYFREYLPLKDSSESVRNNVASGLAIKSGGSFLYATLLVEGVKSNQISLHDLKKYPDGLGSSIYEWFNRIFPDIEEYNANYKLILSALAISMDEIPEQELIRLFGINENDVWNFIQRMQTLIRRQRNAFNQYTISFSYSFLQEWIMSEDAGKMRVFEEEAHRELQSKLSERIHEDPSKMTLYEALNAECILKEVKSLTNKDDAWLWCRAYGNPISVWRDKCYLMMLRESALRCAKKAVEIFKVLEELSKNTYTQSLYNRAVEAENIISGAIKTITQEMLDEAEYDKDSAITINRRLINISNQLNQKLDQSFNEKRTEEMKQLINEYQQNSQEIETHMNLYRGKLELAKHCRNLAILLAEAGQWTDFQKYANQSAALMSDFLTRKTILEAELCLIVSIYRSLAEIQHQTKLNPSIAMDRYEQAENLCKILTQIRGSYENWARLVELEFSFADFLFDNKNYDLVIEKSNYIIYLVKTIPSPKDTNQLIMNSNLGDAYRLMGDSYFWCGDIEKALEETYKSIKSYQIWVDLDKSDSSVSSLYQSYLRSALLHRQKGEKDMERKLLESIMDYCEQYEEKYPSLGKIYKHAEDTLREDGMITPRYANRKLKALLHTDMNNPENVNCLWYELRKKAILTWPYIVQRDILLSGYYKFANEGVLLGVYTDKDLIPKMRLSSGEDIKFKQMSLLEMLNTSNVSDIDGFIINPLSDSVRMLFGQKMSRDALLRLLRE